MTLQIIEDTVIDSTNTSTPSKSTQELCKAKHPKDEPRNTS